MLKQKRPVQHEEEQDQELRLTPELSFLDVINEACKRHERCTLVARSEGRTYSALVDRAGPFSISGGGLSGIDALAVTASLRSGTYTLTDGWTVVQPIYQPGLDAAFRSLTGGSNGDRALPRVRGVDEIRDAIASAGVDVNPWTAAGESRAFQRAPFDAAALAALHPVATATPAPVAFPPAPPVPRPKPAAEPSPVKPAIAAPAPVAGHAPAVEPRSDPEPVPVAPTRQPDDHRRDTRAPEAADGDLVEYLRSAAARSEPEAVEAAGPRPTPSGASRLATRFLLWAVYAEGNPDDYSLRQATGLVNAQLTDAARSAANRLTGGLARRWRSTREDWRRSGELAARDREERARRARSKER